MSAQTEQAFKAHPTEFDAYGYPVPADRLEEALRHLRHMVPDATTKEATTLIDRIASAIERDQPYEIHRIMQTPRKEALLNMLGIYRLWAVLLTHPPGGPSQSVPGRGPKKDHLVGPSTVPSARSRARA